MPTAPTAPAAEDSARGGAQLIVVRGPASGRRFPVRAPVVIGRDPAAAVCVDDDGISRSHFELVPQPGGGFTIRDLESRNGTFVNGNEVGEAPVHYGDRISVGASTTLVLVKHDAIDEQMLRAQRLQSLGELAAGIAHDFNNILAAVLGNISYVRSPVGVSNEELGVVHRDIEVATRKGVDLVKQLLSFAHNHRLDAAPVRLGEMVDQLASLLGRSLPGHIALEVDVRRDLYVVGNESQLGQILTNLCLNAADAMPDGGRLLMRGLPDRIDLGHPIHAVLAAGDYVCLEVVDEGHGMDAETQRRAQEPFFTTKPRGKGTGLGLATVARVVELHGGHLQIDSKLGQGTAVRIWLPRGRETDRHLEAGPRPTLIDLDEKRVLVVDDELIVLRSTARLLERSGASVVMASSGREALELYGRAATPFRLVVLDLDMPEIDGVETLRRIRAMRPDQAALMVTGHLEPARLDPVLALPRVSVLHKPYDYRTLADAVDRALTI